MTYIVTRRRIIGTRTLVYTAWEPAYLMEQHPTITTFERHVRGHEGWWGQIGSDVDPALYEHLPVGRERWAAIDRAYAARAQVAYDLIDRAFPEKKTRGLTGCCFRLDRQLSDAIVINE